MYNRGLKFGTGIVKFIFNCSNTNSNANVFHFFYKIAQELLFGGMNFTSKFLCVELLKFCFSKINYELWFVIISKLCSSF